MGVCLPDMKMSNRVKNVLNKIPDGSFTLYLIYPMVLFIVSTIWAYGMDLLIVKKIEDKFSFKH